MSCFLSYFEINISLLSWSSQLYDAQAEAQRQHRNLWKDYDESTVQKEEEAVQEVESTPSKPTYHDIIISDVRTHNGLTFSVQILNTEGITALEKLMHEFSVYHKSASAPAGFAPKAGELVSAKFSDGAWYRARIRRSSPIKKEAEVTFIDYGNQDTIPFDKIRPLDPRFKSLPGQAHDARLSFVKLVKPESEYYHEAEERFRSLCEGRKLVAIVDHKEGQIQHLRLIDPSDPSAANDTTSCINADLVREGYAAIDKKGCRYLSGHPMEKALKDAVLQAKRDRAGMFEFGDVEEDD